MPTSTELETARVAIAGLSTSAVLMALAERSEEQMAGTTRSEQLPADFYEPIDLSQIATLVTDESLADDDEERLIRALEAARPADLDAVDRDALCTLVQQLSPLGRRRVALIRYGDHPKVVEAFLAQGLGLGRTIRPADLLGLLEAPSWGAAEQQLVTATLRTAGSQELTDLGDGLGDLLDRLDKSYQMFLVLRAKEDVQGKFSVALRRVRHRRYTTGSS